MNYAIIGNTADYSYQDRCGDHVSRPGKFDTQFFREDAKDEFLRVWAHARYHSTYEDLIIMMNGIPEDKLDGDEYYEFQDLEHEMEALLPIMKAEHDKAEQIRKDAAAEAALAKARKITVDQRASDLVQLEALQRKLGVK